VSGQTLQQVRGLLASAGLSPRQRFGQNFLIDLNLMRKLVASAGLTPADVVLEIGPGTGSLTGLLLDSGARVVAAEIDHGMARLLRERLGGQPRFTLVEGDALATKHRINPDLLAALAAQQPEAAGSRKLVANLPYQIATPLLMESLLLEPPFERLCVTVQREVGLRFTAGVKDDAYGPLAIAMQTLARVETIAHLPPAAFWPRPQVDSLMVCIRPLPRAAVEVPDAPAFVAFVQKCFLHRRKTLLAAMRHVGLRGDELLARAGVSPSARAEQLAPADWRALFAVVPESRDRE
jgi:16S rRNA (adenine1518-N6/adenine1519-N6)-dimethyltransferase